MKAIISVLVMFALLLAVFILQGGKADFLPAWAIRAIYFFGIIGGIAALLFYYPPSWAKMVGRAPSLLRRLWEWWDS